MTRNCSVVMSLPLPLLLAIVMSAATKLNLWFLIGREELSRSQGSSLLQVTEIHFKRTETTQNFLARVSEKPGRQYLVLGIAGTRCPDEVSQVSCRDSGWFLVGHGADLKDGREGWGPGAMRNGLPPGKDLYSQEQEGRCAGPTAPTAHDSRYICGIASVVVCTREIIILYNEDSRTNILSLAKRNQ